MLDMKLDLPFVTYTMSTEGRGWCSVVKDVISHIIIVLHLIHFPCGHLRRCRAWLQVRELTFTSRVVVATPDRILEQATESKSGLATATSTYRHDPDSLNLRAWPLAKCLPPTPHMLCTSPPSWASLWKRGLICTQLIVGHQELALALFLRYRLQCSVLLSCMKELKVHHVESKIIISSLL